MTHAEFQEMLLAIVAPDTSSNSDEWKKENPLWGHCAVVALLAQDIFGGCILRASLENTEFSALRSHYWNILMAGEHDFTESQFCGRRPLLVGVIRSRLDVLSYHDTRIRYAKLTLRAYNFLKHRTRT